MYYTYIHTYTRPIFYALLHLWTPCLKQMQGLALAMAVSRRPLTPTPEFDPRSVYVTCVVDKVAL